MRKYCKHCQKDYDIDKVSHKEEECCFLNCGQNCSGNQTKVDSTPKISSYSSIDIIPF